MHLRVPTESEGFFTIVAISPDGKRVAAGSWDRVIRMWDLENGALVATLRGHGDKIQALAFSPDGATLASAAGREILLWNPVRGSQPYTLRHDSGRDWPDAASVSAHGGRVFITRRGITTLWQGEIEEPLLPANGAETAMPRLTPDGRFFLVTGRDSVEVWSVKDRKRVQRLPSDTYVDAAAASADGQWLAFAADDHVQLVDRHTLRTVRRFKATRKPDHQVRFIAFSPDSRTVVATTSDGTVAVHALDRGAVRTISRGYGEIVSPVVFRDGRRAAIAHDDQIVVIDLQSGATLATFSGHTGDIRQIALSEDERTLVSGSKDRTIRFWQVPTGSELFAIEVGAPVHTLSLSKGADGTFAAGLDDGTVHIWRL